MPVAHSRAGLPPGAVPGPRALRGVLSGAAGVQMHLQPIVDLATGEVWGVEALARFPGHPHPGPADWFAEATSDGRGPALEELALRAALALRGRLPQGLRLTVNLSVQALLLPTIQELLLAAPGAGLFVELTEHEQVSDYPALLAALQGIRAAGIGLCIDDFGAGHSSLRHVLHLEPEVVKLDLTLVQGVGACTRRQALVDALVTFCRSTATVLVAEGVEEADDAGRLARLGVGHAQGWFLARPAPLDVVLPVVTSGIRPPVLVLP